MVKNFLMVPCEILPTTCASTIWVRVIDFGPTISSQVWSSFVAVDRPRTRLALGESRCNNEGKYPSIFEKWWG